MAVYRHMMGAEDPVLQLALKQGWPQDFAVTYQQELAAFWVIADDSWLKNIPVFAEFLWRMRQERAKLGFKPVPFWTSFYVETSFLDQVEQSQSLLRRFHVQLAPSLVRFSTLQDLAPVALALDVQKVFRCISAGNSRI